jgi:hypothetical protein
MSFVRYLGIGVVFIALALATAPGCGSDDNNNTGGAGGSTGGAGGSTGGAGGATGGAGGASAGVTYEKDAKPIFVAKCTPCHTDTGIAKLFHTLASSYTDANKASSACPGKKKGECTIVRVKSGDMPQGKMCTGDPAKDSSNSACLTAAEQKTLQDWIDMGLKEK